MNSFEKLDECKKEIRSILISYQRGCYLPEFSHTYRDMIGRKLPSKEFGFKTDIDFLYSIPDVVRVTQCASNQYHLLGIADEKSKHIQKMVCKQKPAKLKGPPLPRIKLRDLNCPPRFREPPRRVSRTTSSQSHDSSSSSARKLTETKSVPSTKQPSPREEMVSLVKSFTNGVALSDLLHEYEKMYDKSFSLEKYGFKSLEECLESISELDLVQIRNRSWVIHKTESSNLVANGAITVQDAQKFPSNAKDLLNQAEKSGATSVENSSFMNSDYSTNQGNNTRKPESLYQKFVKVAKKYSQGMWASNFPYCFEEINGTTFDLHSLGYNCLADCIDEYSDIFTRKHVVGNKKDYIIYPADEFTSDLKDCVKDSDIVLPPVGPLLIDHIILNIRRILEAYPEGIKIQDFLHVYSINCKDSLRLHDLGFSNLETFLSSIKDRVPLKIESVSGVKTVYLRKVSDSPFELPSPSSFVCYEEAIPMDAVSPDYEFEQITFPPDFDFSKFFPVFVSSVAHPGHLYIQFDNENTDEFVKFVVEMDNFYKGQSPSLYTMKNAHIKLGATCAALWPEDDVWYRARIIRIPSMDTVQVHYVDYGTRDVIPRSSLRYLKKEFTRFPAEAIKCSLAFIKPANNASKWDRQSAERLSKLCVDIPLMAKIEETLPNGVHSILLCDTNSDKDVYINDVIRNEGFADYIEDGSSSILASPEPNTTLTGTEQQMENTSLLPLQALQAQYFLHAFATIAPSYAQNEHYVKLLQQVSMYCPNTNTVMQQSPTLPVSQNPFLGAPNLFQPNMNMIPGFNLPYPSALPAFDANASNESPIKRPKPSSFLLSESTADSYLKTTDIERYTSAKSTLSAMGESKNCDSEIFEDDDDEVFQQFCQQVSTTKLRYVKRITLGDGYKIHIIVFESKPYASSGDISQLIWNNKEADYLFRRLQIKNPDIPAVTLSEDGNEELFQQLDRYNVKGVQKTSGFKDSILLYPLAVVIKILNIFGHPSISLRTKLTEEIANFNPSDEIWKEFSAPEPTEPEEDENLTGVTDDDKIERLCLFDLLAMKEGIKCKRMKILSSLDKSDTAKYADEISKLEQMHHKVLQRIKEIKEICSLFA